MVKDGGEKKPGVFAGQLAVAQDGGRGEEQNVTLLTGMEAGQVFSLPRRQLEPYTGTTLSALLQKCECCDISSTSVKTTDICHLLAGQGVAKVDHTPLLAEL